MPLVTGRMSGFFILNGLSRRLKWREVAVFRVAGDSISCEDCILLADVRRCGFV